MHRPKGSPGLVLAGLCLAAAACGAEHSPSASPSRVASDAAAHLLGAPNFTYRETTYQTNSGGTITLVTTGVRTQRAAMSRITGTWLGQATSYTMYSTGMKYCTIGSGFVPGGVGCFRGSRLGFVGSWYLSSLQKQAMRVRRTRYGYAFSGSSTGETWSGSVKIVGDVIVQLHFQQVFSSSSVQGVTEGALGQIGTDTFSRIGTSNRITPPAGA